MAKADMRKLAPGFYDDGAGTIHVDVPELLRELNLPDTPAGRAVAAVALRDAAAAMGIPTTEIRP